MNGMRDWVRTGRVVWIGLSLLGGGLWICPAVCRGQPATGAVRVPEGVELFEDVVYGRGGEVELRIDIAKPTAAAAAPRPCVLVIHGGAWRGGNKRSHVDLILDFAKRGYVSATVQYRLCPQNPFPAQVEDVKCAVRFLRAHADQHAIDPKRVGAVGFSAGAHLAMMLGVMAAEDGFEGSGGWADQPSRVQAVVSFAGPTDLGADDLPEVSVPLVSDFLGGSKAEKADAYRQSSPVTYASAGDAPMLLFQGTRDPLVPYTQAFRMAERLTEAGVEGRVELLIGAGHGWAGDEQKRSMDAMFRFLDARLNRTGP